jgi:hypothetical protein
VGCYYCGGGDAWIKTCLDLGGSRLCVCDPCYKPRASELVIMPGDRVVTARCDGCGVYGNPREFAEYRPGGRHGAFSGTCAACAEEGVGGSRTELVSKGGER